MKGLYTAGSLEALQQKEKGVVVTVATSPRDEEERPPMNEIQAGKAEEKRILEGKIARRPSKIDLKLRNILRVESSDDIVAMGVQKNIDIQNSTTALKSILKKRPQRNELEDKNILKIAESDDPALVATAEDLKKTQLKDLLDNQLSQRPAYSSETLRKLTEFKEDVKVIPTFRKSEYNRKPDNNATFRKLTPKLKMEIREELNNFKRNEMNVHEDSLQNTCFH